MDAVRKSLIYNCKIDDASASERTVTHVITTDAVDRTGEVILPGGIDLKRYQENPVVLLMHGKDKAKTFLPVGKNLWIKKSVHGQKRGLIAKTKFADTDMGRECHQLYAEGILRAWSVGVLPKSQSAPTMEERNKSADWRTCKNVIRECELIEYSAVDIPCNADALTLAVSKGLSLPDWLGEPEEQGDEPRDGPMSESAQTNKSEGDAILIAVGGRPIGQVEKGLLSRLGSIDFESIAAKAAQDAIDRARGRI